MPRRDTHLTVVLGDGPNTDNTWDQGIAVSPDGNDEFGMIKGRPAGHDDSIIGWTIRSQKSGDITTLRTMLDGTIEAKIGTVADSGNEFHIGDTLWVQDDDSGRMTNDNAAHGTYRYIGLALEADKEENSLCEVYIFSQKAALEV